LTYVAAAMDNTSRRDRMLKSEEPVMSKRMTRRRVMSNTARSAGALTFLWLVPRRVLGANERLNVAGIGVGGKGSSDIRECGDEDVVALCDVDDERAAKSYSRFPDAKRYKDYRKMFDVEGKRIDAVTVSTPDHTHAHAAILAMSLGKHVHCQKPLTHSVHEARLMRETAARMKVATQMGNQGHCHDDWRRLVELIQADVIGKVREVYVWTNRPIWPQGMDRPTETMPTPVHLDWDLWLGPAPARPYNQAYAPFRWRGWWDFGTGALGDMGCHKIDLAFFALKLDAPISVEARSSTVSAETPPKWSIITYTFGSRGDLPPVKLTWYDGQRKPPASLVGGRELPANGSILVGDKDTLFVHETSGPGFFMSGATVEDHAHVPMTLPRMPGSDDRKNIDGNHRREWIAACKGGPPALSNFDYAGRLTEAVLLGNVALRAGKRIEWDATRMKVTNVPEADRYIRRAYRKGWELAAS
jgi:predicted dehydrogenase